VVVSETFSSTPGPSASARQRTGWARWLPNRTLGLRFSRFTAGSIFSTLLSQVALTGLYGWGHANATVASLVAFVVGAVPNFVINWKWTWGRDGKPALVRELLPYVGIIVGTGLLATGLTTLTDHLLAPLITDHAWRTVTLDLAYLASYAVLFVLKFALLDRVFGRRKTAQTGPGGEADTATRTTSTMPAATVPDQGV
jgi:putative flippase GtrA